MKVRSENEESFSGAAINESTSLQVNPSHVRNLIQYQASLKSEISEIGNEVVYRPVPSQVSIQRKYLKRRNILS